MPPPDLIFASTIENHLATSVCEFQLWSVDPHLGNPLNKFNELPVFHTVQSELDGWNLGSRYRAIPRGLAQRMDNLRRGLEQGYVANAEAVRLMACAAAFVLCRPARPALLLMRDLFSNDISQLVH